jgi:hypothetical protein
MFASITFATFAFSPVTIPRFGHVFQGCGTQEPLAAIAIGSEDNSGR